MSFRKERRNVPGWVKGVIAAVVVVLITAGSLSVYLIERSEGQSDVVLGDTKSADRIDISVFVQKVDALAQELSAQVEIVPEGSFADDSGYPKQDLTVYTNGTKGDTLPFKAGQSPGTADVKMALNDGVITDYPFDSYQIDFDFAAQTKDEDIPVNVTFMNADSFFRIKTGEATNTDGVLSFSASAQRSTGTFAFALFIMLFMWFLSLAAVIAAWYAIGTRRGLLWPSMSFMGALLFALVPLRNALPGAPPIGSIADFGAFFIAEALISVSLITTVVIGYRVERAKDRAASSAP